MKTYKQSTTMFVIAILIDLLLCCVFIGFFLLPIHILAYLNQSIIIGPKSVVLRTGILNIKTHDIRYSKINSIIVNRGILGRIFGYGTIVIFTGNDVAGLAFKDIDNPEEVKRELDNMIEENSK